MVDLFKGVNYLFLNGVITQSPKRCNKIIVMFPVRNMLTVDLKSAAIMTPFSLINLIKEVNVFRIYRTNQAEIKVKMQHLLEAIEEVDRKIC